MRADITALGEFVPFGLTVVDTSIQERAKYFLVEKELLSTYNRQLPYQKNNQSTQFLDLISLDEPTFDILQEEEILVCGQQVVWSSGETIKKSFTIDHPILQAIVSNFSFDSYTSNEIRSPTNLCILHTGNVHHLRFPTYSNTA